MLCYDISLEQDQIGYWKICIAIVKAKPSCLSFEDILDDLLGIGTCEEN